MLGAAACSPAPRTATPVADHGATADRDASAVLFNHVFAVVDADTARAIASSEELRAFGATESRTTTGATGTWSGFYLYGRETFIEFFPPSSDNPEGKTGLGLQVERIGAVDELTKKLAAAKYPMQVEEQSMKLPDGGMIPWFRYATSTEWPDKTAIDLWVAENHASFMSHRLAPRAVEPADISRRTYLSTKYAPERLLENVVGVTIHAPEADRDRVAAAMAAFGWRARRDGESAIAESGDVTIAVAASREPASLTELRMVLSRDEAPHEVRLGHSTLTLGPGRTARWTFEAHAMPSAQPPPKIENCTVGAFDANKGCVAAALVELPDPFRDKKSPELEKILSKKRTGKDAQDVQNVIDSVEAATTLARRAKGANAKINWYVRAVTSFEKVSFNLVGIPKVALDMAAEAAYSLVALEMEQSFAFETKEKCPGKSFADIFGEGEKPGRWKTLLESAQGYADRIDAVPKKYQSDLWAAIGSARTGIMYARLRASLDACADASGSGASDAFRDRKRTELEAVDELAWKRLTTGLVAANANGVSTEVTAAARVSLRKLWTAIGDDRARAWAEKSPDPFDPERKRTLASFAASLPAPP